MQDGKISDRPKDNISEEKELTVAINDHSPASPAYFLQEVIIHPPPRRGPHHYAHVPFLVDL